MPFEFTLVADDYALSASVSRGIREALAAGRLSGTGAMTNRPGWRRDAPALAAVAGQPLTGLHLNLTLGAPLTLMPEFAPQGMLPPVSKLARAGANALPRTEIAAEIRAQIDAFAQAMGRLPDFVDGHQHVQALAGVRDALFEELGRLPLPTHFMLRDSADRWSRMLQRRSFLLKAAMVALLARGFAAGARRAGFTVNDGFAGFSDFDSGADYGKTFARYLVAPGTRHLVMCHPGHVDDELAAADPVTASRPRELAFLLSPDFPAVLARAGARLAPPARTTS